MARIAEVTEHSALYCNMDHAVKVETAQTTDAISAATVNVAATLDAAAIITCTETGKTAMSISRNRPDAKIVAVTPHAATLRRMQLYWGVQAVLGGSHDNSDEMVHSAISSSLAQGAIESGDLVVITAGVPSGAAGTTNMIRVHVVGQAVLSGNGIGKAAATGRVCLAYDAAYALSNFRDGDVLVVRTLEADLMPLAQRASAIITGEDGYTSAAAIAGLNFGIPVVMGVTGADAVLTNGEVITVDGARGSSGARHAPCGRAGLPRHAARRRRSRVRRCSPQAAPCWPTRPISPPRAPQAPPDAAGRHCDRDRQ